MITEAEFPSEGAVLRSLLFNPESETGKPPVVIMAHGTSATVSMMADKHAEAFCRAGLSVLLYDHRNLGRSGGEPRQEINPWIQTRGYRDAVAFVETTDELDPERIALWGDSYSGAEGLVLGAVDSRVKAVVAQCPVCGAKPAPDEPNEANLETLNATL